MITESEQGNIPLKTTKKSRRTTVEAIVLTISVIFIAATMRAPITSVGPVITEISAELNLGPVLIGLITALPLLSFASLSIFTPKVAKSLGLERLLLYSILLLAFGSLVRSMGNVSLLFLGAALIGAAITIANVLMPALIKKEFPERVGLVTGMYLVAMNLVSALAAGYSIRIGRITGLGWKGSIGIWGVLAVIAFFIWLPQARKKPMPSTEAQPRSANGLLWGSRLAWQVAIFMGLQAFLFYSVAAWLPTVLQSWGMPADRSGWMLSYVQMGQLPIMFVGPIVAAKMKNQRPLVWITFILLLLGLGGLVMGKTSYALASVLLIGISLGLAFTLATMFLVLRTKDAVGAASLSGMSQSVGYLVAACGPPLFGAFYGLSNSWYPSLALLALAGVVLCSVGLASASDRYVPSHEEK